MSAANGRVDLLTPPAGGWAAAQWMQKPSSAPAANVFGRSAIRGMLTPTPLSDLFFSTENVEALQQGIRYRVFTETKKVVDRQSDDELAIYMRAVYLQEARHLPTDLVAQVRELNASVLKQAVANIVSNVKQHEKYIHDVSTLPIPLEKGLSTNVKGNKILELRQRF